jgi:hypothetical protein
MKIDLPIKTVSVANVREHWATRASRARNHRGQAWLMLRAEFGQPPVPTGPVAVTLTRIAPRALDSDNLSSSFKALRDGVADWLRIDDGDERVTWLYQQERGPARTYAVRIEVAA